MWVWKLIFSIFTFSQLLWCIDCHAVRQLSVSESVNPWSLLTAAITQLPRAVLGASVDVTSNGSQANGVNVASSTPSIDIGLAGNGPAAVGNSDSATVGSSGVSALRRGINSIQDSVIAALSRMGTLSSAFDDVTQDGNINIGNLGTSAQQLLRQLINSGYNVVDNVAQDVTQQASLAPSASANFRPARFFSTGARLNDGGRAFGSGDGELVGFNGNVAGVNRNAGGLSFDMGQQPQVGGELSFSGAGAGPVTFRLGDSQLRSPTAGGEFGVGGGQFGASAAGGQLGVSAGGGQLGGSATGASDFELQARQLADDSDTGLDFPEASDEWETLLNSPEGLASLLQMFFSNFSVDGTSTATDDVGEPSFSSVSAPDLALNATSAPPAAQGVPPINDVSSAGVSAEII